MEQIRKKCANLNDVDLKNEFYYFDIIEDMHMAPPPVGSELVVVIQQSNQDSYFIIKLFF